MLHLHSFGRLWPAVLVVLLAATGTCTLLARSPAADTTHSAVQRTPILLSVFAAPVFGIGAPGFADEYRELSDRAFAFDAPLALGATVKTPLEGGWRVGVSAEAYRARFQDNYREHLLLLGSLGDTVRGFRAVYQDFNLKALPVFATVEVIPIEAQFRTYAGVGVGLAYTEMFWSESISNSLPEQPRTGGVHIDEQRIVPAFRLYTGIELGFDRSREGTSALHSLFVEGRYSYIPVSLPLLRNVAAQVEDAPEQWQEQFTLQAGGFSLVVGLCLRFVR